MLIELLIRENRELKIQGTAGKLGNDCIGTTGENNATILHLVKPETINGEPIGVFTTRLVFGNSAGSFIKYAASDELALSADLTTEQELTVSVQFLKNNVVKWESFPLRAYLMKSTDDSGVNAFDSVREEQRQTDRAELGAAINACYEANGLNEVDYSESTWNDLLDVVGQTLLLTPDQAEDLADYAATKSAAAQTENKNPVDMINVWKFIEQEAAKATNYIPLVSVKTALVKTQYSVPYLHTVKVNTLASSGDAVLSQNCVSCGFDCSSMDGDGLTKGNVSFFAGLNFFGSPNLQNAKITNMQTVTTCYNLFFNCPALQTVDLDGLQATNLYQMFKSCTSLTNIILHNSIIKDSLNLSETQNLTEDSVITVLQATGTGLSKKTITFNSKASEILTGAAANAKSAAVGRGWQIAIA